MRAERTKDSDVKNFYRNIYQSEIADEQRLEEKAEMLNK